MARGIKSLREAIPADVRLLAVSKGQSSDMVRAAVAAGQRSFAESRYQEAAAKQLELADLPPLDWHFIGRLQANKVRAVLRRFGTIHSLDSLDLARRVARIAAEEGLKPTLLCQVKLRPDPNKTGFSADELRRCWPALKAMDSLCPAGLMTIAPMALEPDERREMFQECAALARELGLRELSMGMSGDWPEAIAAGSTWVRIGSGLFGSRL